MPRIERLIRDGEFTVSSDLVERIERMREERRERKREAIKVCREKSSSQISIPFNPNNIVKIETDYRYKSCKTLRVTCKSNDIYVTYRLKVSDLAKILSRTPWEVSLKICNIHITPTGAEEIRI